MAAQREGRARREAVADTAAAAGQMVHLLRREPQACRPGAVGGRGVAAREGIAAAARGAARCRRVGRQDRRVRIVVVGDDMFGLHQPHRHFKRVDALECIVLSRIAREPELRAARAGLLRRRAVREHHGVHAVGEREKVKDALFFHQPRDELQRAFVVLHAVFAHRVSTGHAQLDRHTGVRQQLLDDIQRALVLVDRAVAAEREQREARGQFSRIEAALRIGADLRKTQDDAIEKTTRPRRRQQRHSHALADDRLRIEPRVRRAHAQMEAERLRHRLAAAEAFEHQHVGAERRADRQQAADLGGGHFRHVRHPRAARSAKRCHLPP
jgi:hypothetical protein